MKKHQVRWTVSGHINPKLYFDNIRMSSLTLLLWDSIETKLLKCQRYNVVINYLLLIIFPLSNHLSSYYYSKQKEERKNTSIQVLGPLVQSQDRKKLGDLVFMKWYEF